MTKPFNRKELTQETLELELSHVIKILSTQPKSDFTVQNIAIGINSNHQYGSDEYVKKMLVPLLKKLNIKTYSEI